MSDLTYVEPPGLPETLAVGAVVEVCDRYGVPFETTTVVKIMQRRIRTACGREWARNGWWWDQRSAWPFPFIRTA